jgi:creatinine amidohydrolase
MEIAGGRLLSAIVGRCPFGIAHDHRGAAGLVHVRLDTFVSVLRDVCHSLADTGFRRIVLLNGHYCNSHAMEFAVAQFLDELPDGTRVYPFPYWAGLRPEEAEQYLSGTAGIHANVGETSIVLAITRSSRHGASARLHAGPPELRTSRCAADPLFLATRGFWCCSRTAALGRRASRPSRRARSSSAGARPRSSTSSATWRTCTISSSRAT